jgi:hypothetical protein
MPARRIKIRALGSDEDHGHLRFADFIKQLDLVRNALKQTERQMTGEEGRVYWRVVDLRHSSPATVTLEEVLPRLTVTKQRAREKMTREQRQAEAAPPIIERFMTVMSQIRARATVPENRHDLSLLESYRELSSVTEQHVASFQIEAQRKRVKIDATFRKNIDTIIGPDELVEGSLTGMVEAINLHNTLRFNLYPIVGPKKVAGAFSADMKREVIEAIDRYVRIHGTLRYKSWAPYPHAIDVKSIEVLPHDDDLPTLGQLRGVAPEATSDMTSEDFVRAHRDDSW